MKRLLFVGALLLSVVALGDASGTVCKQFQTCQLSKLKFSDGTSQTSAAGVSSPNVTNATGTLAINHGGTGSTTAAAARTALLPDDTGHASQFLQADGSHNFSWAAATSTFASGYGVYASRPAPGTAGNLYHCTNCPNPLYVDSGSAWAPIVAGMSIGTQPKAASNFSTNFVRGGGAGATITDQNGSLRQAYGVDSGGTNTPRVSGNVESLSSATMHVETSCGFELALGIAVSNSFIACGVVMRESSSGKLATWMLMMDNAVTNQGTTILEAAYWSAPQTRTNNTQAGIGVIQKLFLKLERNGSNILYRYSTDSGTTWVTYQTTATSTIFSSAPDQVGVANLINATTDAITADFFHYVSGS